METQNTCGDLCLESLAELLKLRTNAERAVAPITQKYGLTPVQAVILHLINGYESPTVGTIFKALDLNQGNVSSTCKKLESDGFIERRRSENDERRVVLFLTEKGERSVRMIGSDVSDRYPLMKSISKGDIALAESCIRTLKGLAEKLNDTLITICEDSNA